MAKSMTLGQMHAVSPPSKPPKLAKVKGTAKGHPARNLGAYHYAPGSAPRG